MRTKINLSPSKYWHSKSFSRLFGWWKEKNLELSIDSKEIPTIKTNEFLKSNWYSLGYYNWKLDRCIEAMDTLRNKKNKTIDDKLEIMRLSRLKQTIENDIVAKCSPH